MSLQHAAHYLAAHGRGPDDTLVHMTRREVQSLQDIARAQGGSLSINPETGLVEAGFLSNLLPMIAGAALTATTGIPAWAIGLGVGGVQAARTGSLEKGLMAGMGAYGGSGLMTGLTAAAGNTASELAAKDIALGGQGGSSAAAQYMPSATDNFMSGVKGLGTEAGRSAAINAMGGGFNAAKTAGMALAPALTDTGDQKAPPSDNEAYNYKYDPGRVEDPNAGYTGAFTGERTYFKPSYTRLPNIKFSEGGVAHFDNGGPTDDPNKTAGLQAAAAAQGVQVPFAQQAVTTKPAGSIQPVTSNPYYTMTGASGDAYKYLMGLNPASATAKPVAAAKPNITTDNTSSIDSGTKVVGGVRGGGGGGGVDQTLLTDLGSGSGENIVDVTGGGTDTDVTGGGTDTDVTGGGTDTDVTGGGTDTDVTGGGTNNVAVDDGTTAGINDIIQNMDGTAQDDGTTAGINDVIEGMDEVAQDDGTTAAIQDQILAQEDPWGNLDKAITDNTKDNYYRDLDRYLSDVSSSIYSPTSNPGYGPNPFAPIGSSTAFGGTSTPSSTSGTYSGFTPAAANPNIPVVDLGPGGYSTTGYPGGIPGYEGYAQYGGVNGGGKYFDDQSAATMAFATGGIADAHYNLGGYSDGGRLLRGPGDGVSDSIPATIGRNKQPARLADGEFVVPARIVSELGNGSTEAGARKLYAMMDRIQAARSKTVGKNRVAANTRADRHLPA